MAVSLLLAVVLALGLMASGDGPRTAHAQQPECAFFLEEGALAVLQREVCISLEPETDSNLVGTDHTVTATVTENDIPSPEWDVVISVLDGPNAGKSNRGVTNARGQFAFAYTGDGGPGTDIIQASIIPVLEAQRRAIFDRATKEWVELTLSLEPETDSNLAGTDHTVTATVTADGEPLAGGLVAFFVAEGPNQGFFDVNDADFSGQVSSTYTGDGGPGTDGIFACTSEFDIEECFSFFDCLLELEGDVEECVNFAIEAGLVIVFVEARKEWVEPLPDLILLDVLSVEEDDLLIILATIENFGDAPAPETFAIAESQDADWAAEAFVPALDSGESVQVAIELEIRDDVRDQRHRFRVEVDPVDEIAEGNEDNNQGFIEVAVPEEEEEIPWALILAVSVGVTVTLAGLSGGTLTIRRTVKIRRRKEWQEKAKEEKPPETCETCTRYCRKVEIELELARRAITHLTLVAYDPASGEKRREIEVKGEVVDGLNQALRAHRRGEEREEVQRLVQPVAGTLSQQIEEWLGPEAALRDVSVAAHLKGGEVTFKFILYHCTDNVWKKEDEWEEKVEDERDETVATLPGLDPSKAGLSERVAPELTQRLMQFIENV